MRRLCGTLLCAALLWLLCLPAAAAPAESTESAKSAKPADTAQLYAQQLSASGGDALTERLPADARALLEELQVDVSRPESFTGLSANAVLSMLTGLLHTQKNGLLQAAASLAAVVLLCAMLSGLEEAAERPSLRQTYHTVTVLAAGGLLLSPITALMVQVQQAAQSAGVFMLSFVPVYAGILSAGGSAAAALSYQTTLLAAAELLVQLCRTALLPVLSVSLAMGCTGAVADGFCLESFSAALHKAVLWVLSLLATVFSGVLSVQQMVAAAGDTLGRRAMKFSISSFVPVVGGRPQRGLHHCAGLRRAAAFHGGVLRRGGYGAHGAAAAGGLPGLEHLPAACRQCGGTVPAGGAGEAVPHGGGQCAGADRCAGGFCPADDRLHFGDRIYGKGGMNDGCNTPLGAADLYGGGAVHAAQPPLSG